MPRRDGKGPMGQGAMTGRGLGYCTETNEGLYGAGMGRGVGRGMGRGMSCGLGLGFRRGFGGFDSVQLPEMTDQEVLTEQKELLQKRLDIINKQLDNQPESEK